MDLCISFALFLMKVNALYVFCWLCFRRPWLPVLQKQAKISWWSWDDAWVTRTSSSSWRRCSPTRQPMTSETFLLMWLNHSYKTTTHTVCSEVRNHDTSFKRITFPPLIQLTCLLTFEFPSLITDCDWNQNWQIKSIVFFFSRSLSVYSTTP